jgi:anti-sigma factor RsiW
MKRCSKVVALLVDYLEQHLAPAVHAELERHLEACPRCVAHLRTYQSTLSLLHSLEEDDLPAELRLSLRSFLDGHATN